MSRLSWRYWPRKDGTDSNLLHRADKARDAYRWDEAAALYGRAARAYPHTASGLWVQAGNCAKEAGNFATAFDYYGYAMAGLDASPSASREGAWRATRGDLLVQLGHLFKLTGNFSASKASYLRAASHGDANGVAEFETFASITPSVMTFGRSDGAGLPVVAFQTIAACELRPLSTVALRAAAQTLAEWPETRHLAGTYGELAFLCDHSPDAAVLHRAFMSSLLLGGTLPETGIAPPQYAERDARMKLRSALLAVAASLQQVTPNASANTHQKAQPAPESDRTIVLDDRQAHELSRRLQASVRAAHDSVWERRPGFAERFGDAVKDLAASAHMRDAIVVLCGERSPGELLRAATRTLHQVARTWLAEITGDHCQNELSSAMLAFRFDHGETLRARRRQLGSQVALYTEIETLLYGILNDEAVCDVILAAVATGDPDGLSALEARELLQRTQSGPRLTEALLAVVFRDATSHRESLSYCALLKERGLLEEALLVLSRHDEECVPAELLLEKALVSKSLGHFDQAGRLLEGLYRSAPTSFLRSELLMVLPEVESIEAILGRYAGDADFLEAASQNAVFRLELTRRSSAWQQSSYSHLAPEVAPPLAGLVRGSLLDREEIDVLGLGAGERETPLGRLPVLRTIDFARARVSSRERLLRMRVRLNGRTVATCLGSSLTKGFETSTFFHQNFNAWFETTGLQPGVHSLQLSFEEHRGGYRNRDINVWVDPSESGPADKLSPSFVRLPSGDEPLASRISALPSESYPAERSYFDGNLDRILVMRADQLGDTVLSLPAAAALRRYFPNAVIDALVSPAQVELVRGSGLFDEVFSVAFPYDQIARRRFLNLPEQETLAARLSDRGYDLAIDLSPSDQTRPLLKLAGARYTAGFKPEAFPWLDIGFDFRARELGNRKEAMPHARAPLALVEAIATAALGECPTLPKVALETDYRQFLGLGNSEAYAVFHSGARTASRKWPLERYLKVAQQVLDQHGMRVVLMLDDPIEMSEISPELQRGVIVLKGHPTFSQFDGLISNAAVFLGNDTGPKHLAALRGTPVVSIHMGAVNWSEWGQDGNGLILTRRVPCYGCGIELAEECGRNLPCLFDITIDDVVRAIASLLSRTQSMHVSDDLKAVATA